MLVIPAIDLKGGACVRLVQGDPRQETVYSSDPLEMTRRWAAEGARRIHVVDLDGALGSKENNLAMVFKMQEQAPGTIQFGGGLRDRETVLRVLQKGVARAIIGTALLKDPFWVKDLLSEANGRVMASVDARDGQVMVEGWQSGSGMSLAEVIKRIEAMGLKEIVYTDIRKDGMMQGPNLQSLRVVLGSTKMGVYASGGVSDLEDVRALNLLEKEHPHLKGCIIGKALYTGRIRLSQALAVAR